ncbi:hypothetical protein BGZ65_006716 [Modicella reniformis]|uniref:Peptidase M14 domain-containing protein n=1 Tax=Modicella reniformis TaxID=1440133 RepID=A0A9P6M2F5_9FUNG|nr:hypothetical protein BGZ65_006716 [Modicella reniformis]
MRLSLSQISLTAVVALGVILSTSWPSAEALPVGAINRRPHFSSTPLVARSAAALKSYDQHRVVRVNIQSEDQLKILTENEDSLHFDYFTHEKNIGGNIDIRLTPEDFVKFQSLNIGYTILIDNLQTILDQERDEDGQYQQKWENSKLNKVSMNGVAFPGNDDVFTNSQDWFSGYHSYEDHQTWLQTQIKKYATIASAFSAGKSFQNREQAGIKIGNGPNNVVFHGLQHSREWITGSVVEYLIDQLLRGTDSRVAGYLKKYTFHIIPIMNPDGFVITQSSDRMHRKNAQKNGECLGTDTNRNWNFHWNEGGASTDPCADSYMGPSAFSAPEAKNIGEYLKKLPNVVSYIDFHSYSQLWMTPYGFTGKRPDNYDTYLKPLAVGAVAALKAAGGTVFQAGDIYNTIYPASGSSVDYALSVGVGAPFAVELRDRGEFGFSLPANQIIPSGKEVWAAFTYILDNLKTK